MSSYRAKKGGDSGRRVGDNHRQGKSQCRRRLTKERITYSEAMDELLRRIREAMKILIRVGIRQQVELEISWTCGGNRQGRQINSEPVPINGWLTTSPIRVVLSENQQMGDGNCGATDATVT